MARSLIGTSGYSYEHWKDGVFYPHEVKQPHWLEYYSERFGTVELNVTHYNLPKRETFEHWRDVTPDGFRFALKGSRLITHFHRLHDVDEAVSNFFAAASALERKLEVVLWQLPPKMKADPARLDAFCALARETTDVRHAFEFREPSWFAPETYEVLRRHRCALCIADSPALKTPREITAGFTYLRFHGGSIRGDSDYSEGEIRTWAARVRAWLDAGTDTYAYFNNDAHGYAPKDAAILARLVVGTKTHGQRPAGRV